MRVACVGAADIDRKLHLLSAVVPGSSNPARAEEVVGGVACNVARACAALGLETAMAGIVGRDAAGDRVLAALAAAGVDTTLIARSADRPTASYSAVLDPGGGLVVGVAVMGIHEELDEAWAERIGFRLAACDTWVVDANPPAAVLRRLLETRADDAFVAADPVSAAKAANLRPVLGLVDALFPDAAEAAVLAGHPVAGPADAARAAKAIRRLGPGVVVVTLGGEGIVVADDAGTAHLAAIPPARVVDVTGAGDVMIAGYLLGRAQGEDAPLYGLAAASLAVESDESVPAGLTAAAVLRRLEER